MSCFVFAWRYYIIVILLTRTLLRFIQVVPAHSVLIFCPTKIGCEETAKQLIDKLPSSAIEHRAEERAQLIARLEVDAEQVDELLKKTLPYGVAYHHSGVTSQERELIEEAFSKRIICIITCTSTLAAGMSCIRQN